MRGKFSLSDKQQGQLIATAKELMIEGILVISTCNRTEVYGMAANAEQMIQLICEYSNGTLEDFENYGFVFENEAAINHLFRVGTGLDSQILGDFEIIGQIKQGLYRSKKHQVVNPFLERLCNAVLQAARK